MKRIILVGLFAMSVLGYTEASEYNGSIDSSNGISTNSLEVTLPCSPSSVTNGTVNATTCVITCNTNYTLSSNQCVANAVSGGGGGGGGGTIITTTGTVTSTGNTTKTKTKTLKGEVETINNASSGDINNSPYSSELNQAYQFAFGNGITSAKTIKKANLEGQLSRKDMAKMMVNYAINVLEKTPSTGSVCEFKDMKNESKEINFYAKLSCQLGLMGVGSLRFNPNGLVTRAEFGTILSRSLYGNIFDGGAPFYKKHLTALKKFGIIKNISPKIKELKGNVMLMLMRASEAGSAE